MSDPFVDIYIITRNRDKYFNEAIKSILNLNYKNFNIIISDNSTNKNISNIFNKKYKNNNKIKYIKRDKNFELFEHIKCVFNESESQYLVIFHDDDVLERDYLKISMKYFKDYHNLCAIGVNGIIIDEDSRRNFKRKKMYNSNQNKIFQTPKSLLYQYFGYKTLGVCHHSGFIYDLKKIKNIINTIDFTSNSNSLDAYYLSKFLNVYDILYIAKPLMKVRFHSLNLNNYQSLNDRLFILNKIRNEFGKNDKNLIDSFRYCLYFFWKKNVFLKKNYIKKKLILFRIRFLIFFYIKKLL